MAIKFNRPEVFEKNKETGHYVVNKEKSEEFVLLENDFIPHKVFYAIKSNRYYKDNECTKPYMDAEILALGLPIPAEIQNERNKMQKKYADKGEMIPLLQIQRATAPKELPLPAAVAEKIVKLDPIEKKINKLNAATLRK